MCGMLFKTVCANPAALSTAFREKFPDVKTSRLSGRSPPSSPPPVFLHVSPVSVRSATVLPLPPREAEEISHELPFLRQLRVPSRAFFGNQSGIRLQMTKLEAPECVMKLSLQIVIVRNDSGYSFTEKLQQSRALILLVLSPVSMTLNLHDERLEISDERWLTTTASFAFPKLPVQANPLKLSRSRITKAINLYVSPPLMQPRGFPTLSQGV